MGRPKGIPHTQEWKQAQSERMKGRRYDRKPKFWKIEDLPAAVAQSKSWTGLASILGLKNNNAHSLQKWTDKLGLDTSHFSAEWLPQHTLKDTEIFCEDSRHPWGAKNRFRKRTPEVCMLCGQGPVWNNKPLRFQIDHKNGDSRDCRWENLQKICPNCHTQTDTYTGRNRVVTDGKNDKLNGSTIWCAGCSLWLDPKAFGNKASMPNGKQSRCKTCMREVSNGASA